MSDDEWFAYLKKTYTWLDVDREAAKAKAWLMTHPGRTFTRRFFTNWLNKVERPVETVAGGEVGKTSYLKLMADAAVEAVRAKGGPA